MEKSKTKTSAKRSAKKTGGRDFKPGFSGNPKGRPKTPTDLSDARLAWKANRTGFTLTMSQLARLPMSKVHRIAKNEKASEIERKVARVLSCLALRGDVKRMEFVLNVLLGPPSEASQ